MAAQNVNANTSSVSLHLKDTNNSAINLLEFSNTLAIYMECESGHQVIESSDKAIVTSFVELMDTYVSNEMCDKNTSAWVESTNKSTSVDTNCLDLFRHKETITECLTSSEAIIKADKSISTMGVLHKDVNTSTVASIKPEKSSHSISLSPILHFNEDFVSKEMFNQLVNDLKEKEAMIAFNRKIVEQRDQSLKSLEEENSRLKANAVLNWQQLLKKPRMQTSSTASSIATSISSMPSVRSIKSEDVTSVSGLESIPEKPKKSSKYSFRKRKPILNNSDKRYLQSVSEALEITVLEEKSSQNSVVSAQSSTIGDEIKNDVYFTKKRSNRKIIKRKMNNNMNENEYKELNRAPESKRKRSLEEERSKKDQKLKDKESVPKAATDSGVETPAAAAEPASEDTTVSEKLQEKVREKERRKQEKKEQKRKDKSAKVPPHVTEVLTSIDNDIKDSLTKDNPNIDRCLEAMERLKSVHVTPQGHQTYGSQLKALISTLKKCRKYKADERVLQMSDQLYYKFTASIATIADAGD